MNRIMPRVGSVVRVTTRHQNINIFTYKERPFDEFVKEGVVVQGRGDEGPETFTLLTQNKMFNKSVIALSAITKLEFIKGSGMHVNSPVMEERTTVVQGSFNKKTGKHNEYVVTRQGDVWFCQCEGFKFRRKCGHLEKSGL